MQEYRSFFFIQLFNSIGIEYGLHGKDCIAHEIPLKNKGVSLVLYFNEATDSRNRGVYFAASKNLYKEYNWEQYWLFVDNARIEDRHFKVTPFPGKEELALKSLIEYCTR